METESSWKRRQKCWQLGEGAWRVHVHIVVAMGALDSAPEKQLCLDQQLSRKDLCSAGGDRRGEDPMSCRDPPEVRGAGPAPG